MLYNRDRPITNTEAGCSKTVIWPWRRRASATLHHAHLTPINISDFNDNVRWLYSY